MEHVCFLFVILLSTFYYLLDICECGNAFCEYGVSSNTVITRFEGYMNVPIKPSVEPETVLFLWPGVNPYGGEGGLMQPVLTYGENYGQGDHVWGIAQWFSDCPGYCHDKYQAVYEGDTIYFYMQYIETYTNNSQHWEMGYQAYNNPTIKSTFQIYRSSTNVETLWATEAEFYINASDPSNSDKLPLSYFYTWDLKATTNNKIITKFDWTTNDNDPNGNYVNCSYNVNNNNVEFMGTKLIYQPYNDGCQNGYSRDWNSECQSYCGCNNNDDTPKIQCDYCCQVSNGSCERSSGPSTSKLIGDKRNKKELKTDVDTSKMIHPGNLISNKK